VCVHLATWAVYANVAWFDKEYLLDFLNMTAYHVCVLIWFYYLLRPDRRAVTVGRDFSDSRAPASSSVGKILGGLLALKSPILGVSLLRITNKRKALVTFRA